MSDARPKQDLPRLRAREGFALALTLGSIVVIGLLIAGLFFMTNQQTRGSRTTMLQERAFRLAEAGLAQSINAWSNADVATLADGSSLPETAVPVPNVPVDMYPMVTITRLNGTLFQVVSRSTVGSGAGVEAVRNVNQLVRMMSPIFNILGALTVRGATKIGGNSLINGTDHQPSGWTCDATEAALPGIAIADDSLITLSGCGGYSCVTGDPKVEENALANDTTTFTVFGDYTWAEMVAMANVVVTVNENPQPVLRADGTCNQSVTRNWGDTQRLTPPGACEPYFPIIYIPGNGMFTGGSGQGILLVEGDLEVQGGFQFYGPVIIKGRLKTAGTGGHFNGAVMAANVDLEENSVLGNAVVNYSSCAVETALRNAGKAMPVRQRGWSESF